jgi:predicted ATP-binding protein involved in virulence
MGNEAQSRAASLESPQQGVPTDSTMIHSVEIKRFRCFREAKVEGLRRINVIVGGSGSGKTAFLEALFMCAGMGADVFLRTKGWRGAAWLASTQITTGGAQAKMRLHALIAGCCEEEPSTNLATLWKKKGNPIPLASTKFNELVETLKAFTAL